MQILTACRWNCMNDAEGLRGRDAMTKRILSIILILIVVLSGCASADKEQNTATPIPRTEESVPEELSAAPEEVTEEPQAESNKDEREDKAMKIKVTDGTHTVIYQLNDSPSAKSLYSMLPMDVEVENYGSNEKIFYPDGKIDTAGGIEGGGGAGDLALFSPWGNVVMYYGSFNSYPGLYLMGTAVEGTDQVKDLSGTIHIEIEK